jgi:hypothetical protein
MFICRQDTYQKINVEKRMNWRLSNLPNFMLKLKQGVFDQATLLMLSH